RDDRVHRPRRHHHRRHSSMGRDQALPARETERSMNLALARKEVPSDLMQTSNPIIEVKGVSKIYGDVQALQDINLGFEAGHLTSLLGPSGCGKTTLLKIVAGLLEPSDGQVLVKGRPV